MFRNSLNPEAMETDGTISDKPKLVTGGPCLALIGQASQSVCRTGDAASAAVQDVGVNHRRANVLVAQQFLHGAETSAIGQQVRGERMAERVAGDSSVSARLTA